MFERRLISYYEEDSTVHFANVIKGVNHIAFSKREEYFSLQQEYRFLADIEVQKEFILDIGNIEDITSLYAIEDFLEKEYKAILTLID